MTLWSTCWLVRRASHISPSSLVPLNCTGTSRLPWLNPASAARTWALGSTMLRIILKAIMSTTAVAITIMPMIITMPMVELRFC